MVGAGPSGLVACKELLSAGFDVSVFEKQSSLGGAFATCYDGFLFTTSTHLSAFSDFPEEKPSHHWNAAQFIDYCSRYVHHFGFEQRLMFNSCVTSVKRDHQQFAVTVNNESSTRLFDFVVVCSGLNHAPKDAELHPSAIHSSQIRNLEQFQGKRVLLVGGSERECEFFGSFNITQVEKALRI